MRIFEENRKNDDKIRLADVTDGKYRRNDTKFEYFKEDNAKLSFKQLTLLLKNTPNLKILHLNIQDLNEMAGLPEFICKFSRLEQLSLLRRQIKDDGLRVICENLPKLSIFNIG